MTRDPTAVTRVLFEDFAPAAIAAFYVVAFAAVTVFCFGVYVEVRKYRRGSAADVDGRLLARFQAMIGTVLSHRTVAHRDRAAGAAHRLIFYEIGRASCRERVSISVYCVGLKYKTSSAVV